VTEFVETILTADDLSASSLSQSQIVLLMFGMLWGVGLLAILSHCLYQRRKTGTQSAKEDCTIPPTSTSPTQASLPTSPVARLAEGNDDMISSLKNYLEQSFPSVYHRSNSYFDRMVTEICNNHPYIEIFASAGDEDPELQKIVSFVKLLTELTMFMFMLAAFYELEVCCCCSLPASHDPSVVSYRRWDLRLNAAIGIL
jgi:hypothetical protein